MRLASLVLSIVGALFVFVVWFPFLGIVNYFVLLLLTLGLIFGCVGMVKKNGIVIAVPIICLVCIMISSYRFYIGA